METNYKEILKRVLGNNQTFASPIDKLGLWEGWYRGKVNNFHNYKIYNGKKYIHCKKKSMQAAKRVCEDWASLIMNEKVQIVSKAKDKLTDILDALDFEAKENKGIELGFALSMSAVVVDISGEMDEKGNIVNGKLDFNVYSAKSIMPLTIHNNQITECAFVQDNTKTYEICAHLKNSDGLYEIHRISVNKENGKEKVTKVSVPLETPLFHIIYPNIVNNIDVDSPYPISIFANAIDTLESLDNKYDSYDNEFVLGRKRVYVAAEAFNVNKETGEIERVFDPYDPLIYNLPSSVNKDGTATTLVRTDSDTLRAIEHQLAIQDELNYLAQKVGLGNEYYRLEKGRVMTATQVISEKSDTFRNKKRHEKPLKKGILDIIESFMRLYNEVIEANTFSEEDIKTLDVRFDDSIIEDTESQKTSDRIDVDKGIMSRIEYRVKWYGEDEKTAKEITDKYFGDIALSTRITAFLPALQSGGMTVEQFVNQVYLGLDETQKAKIIAELGKIQASAGGINESDIGGINLDINP